MFGCIYPDMCIAYNLTSSDRSIAGADPGGGGGGGGRTRRAPP